MTLTTSPALVQTRESWHRVAEHVLAAGQFAAAGTIRLRPFPGGFATAVGVGGRLLAVVAGRLLVVDGADFRSRPLTTLRAAAAFAGVDLGLRGSYTPATSVDPDEPLRVDPAAAGRGGRPARAAGGRSGRRGPAGRLVRPRRRRPAALRRGPRAADGAGALARALRRGHRPGGGELRRLPR